MPIVTVFNPGAVWVRGKNYQAIIAVAIVLVIGFAIVGFMLVKIRPYAV